MRDNIGHFTPRYRTSGTFSYELYWIVLLILTGHWIEWWNATYGEISTPNMAIAPEDHPLWFASWRSCSIYIFFDLVLDSTAIILIHKNHSFELNLTLTCDIGGISEVCHQLTQNRIISQHNIFEHACYFIQSLFINWCIRQCRLKLVVSFRAPQLSGGKKSLVTPNGGAKKAPSGLLPHPPQR